MTQPGGSATANLAESVLFAYNSAVLVPEALGFLDGLAAQIRERGAGALTVTGHSDDVGSDAFNLALSKARADAVAAALTARLAGAPVAITASGLGKANPVAPNTDEAGRAKNRRVELTFIPTPQP